MHLTPALLSSILITATSGGIAMILVIGEARNVGNDTVGELLLVSSAKDQSVDRERIREILRALKDGATLTLTVRDGKKEYCRILAQKGDNLFL